MDTKTNTTTNTTKDTRIRAAKPSNRIDPQKDVYQKKEKSETVDPQKVGKDVDKPTDKVQVDANKTSSSVLHLIVTAPSQTGDVYHVAAALALDKYTDVMVLGHSGGLQALGDKTLPDSDALIEYYQQAAAASSGVGQPIRNRVHNIGYIKPVVMNDALIKFNKNVPKSVDWITDPNLSDSRGKIRENTLKALKMTSGEYELQSFREYLEDKEKKWRYYGITLKKTTWKISDCYESKRNPNLAQIYSQVADALKSRKLSSKDIISTTKDQVYFGVGHNIGLPSLLDENPVLLLWSRYSGSSKVGGGYMPEGDGDLIGQQQLIQIAKDLGFRIITIGHEPNRKWELVRNLTAAHSSSHLGEFYKVPPITEDRATQISFFLALMELYPGKLYQMGQKTGGMDGAALVGIPTVYIECDSKNEQARMSKWVDQMPFYQDANISQPPSILGKAIFSLNKEIIGGQPEEKENIKIHDIYSPKNQGKSSLYWGTVGEPKEIRFSIVALLHYIWICTKDINAALKGCTEANKKEKLEEVSKNMKIWEVLKNDLKGEWGEKLRGNLSKVLESGGLESGGLEKITGVVNEFPSIKLGAIWTTCITCLNHLDHTVFDKEKPLRGYSETDQAKIKKQLADMLHEKYTEDEDIVRNQGGKYVQRKALKH